jgi:hypothetical protein
VTNPLIFVVVVVVAAAAAAVDAAIFTVSVTVVFIHSFIQASSSLHRFSSLKIQLIHLEWSLALRSVRPQLIVIIVTIIIKRICYIHNI